MPSFAHFPIESQEALGYRADTQRGTPNGSDPEELSPAIRPAGVTALSIFFATGAVIAFTSCVSRLVPGSFLEPMWRLNPRALEAFSSMGVWAIVLLGTVGLACALAAVGLWRGRGWGYWLAIGLLGVNLVGDVVNVVLGTERRAAFGVPVGVALLLFLTSRRVRSFFGQGIRA
jgi:hypothetical protein